MDLQEQPRIRYGGPLRTNCVGHGLRNLKQAGTWEKLHVDTALCSGMRKDERGEFKEQILSTHVARKTFVTLSLERNMHPEVLMSFTEHHSFKSIEICIATPGIIRRQG